MDAVDDDEKKSAELIIKAAGDVRRAASLDKKRTTELVGVADYLESIVYESELEYDKPLFPESQEKDSTQGDDVKSMLKPFRVRLSR